MRKIWEDYRWILATAVGSTIFALGFSLFLQPNEISPGGISGLALVAVELLGYGSVGVLTIIINLPLFILGGVKIGRRFFCGSLLGMVLSSILIDAFAKVAMPPMDSLLCALYGGMICGLGLGMVFICGTSTGGSDIVVRLLKLKYRDVPIGQISMCFDAGVAVLTGIVFQDITKALYTGVAVFVTGKVLDAVVYRFDYSKVALIITKEYDAVEEATMPPQDADGGQDGTENADTTQDTQEVTDAAEGTQESQENHDGNHSGESTDMVEGHLDPAQLEEMNKDDLKKLAKDMGVDLPRGAAKALIVERLAAAIVQTPAAAIVPPAADNGGGAQ